MHPLSSVETAIDLRGIWKRFGGVVANAGLSLRVQAGTIHGIIGENGAGKSTAMNILYGLQRPDAGEILITGRRCDWSSPRDAIEHGLGMVHQHFMLAGPFTALDNILLGAEGSFALGQIARAKAAARVQTLAVQYGLAVDLQQPVEALPIGIQQRVELLKLLYRQAGILILDEPTAVLTPQETNALFHNLARLRDEGKTILFVTHKLREVMAFTDRVTVLRAGKVAGETKTAQTSAQDLADLMVGRKVVLNVQASAGNARHETALEVAGLTLASNGAARDRLCEVSLSVKRGEIVGIAGVEGNGQSELLQAILHPRDRRCRTAGTVRILGHDVTPWKAAAIRELEIGFIPEDRLHEGLLPQWTIAENFLLGQQQHPEYSRAGFLSWRKIEGRAAQAVAGFDVRASDLSMRAGQMSGGNQQKLIAARELGRRPKLLIAAQPTRGVDVGAIEAIHRRLIQARDEGAAVLLVSSELEEIMALSDRILVMYEGQIAAEFARGEATESLLGLKMGGA